MGSRSGKRSVFRVGGLQGLGSSLVFRVQGKGSGMRARGGGGG